MLNLKINKDALEFHHSIVKCWLLIKLKGGKSKQNGYNCNKKECLICNEGIHINKFNQDLRTKFLNFLLISNNLDVLISGKPNELIILYGSIESGFTAIEKSIIGDFFINEAYTNWFRKSFGYQFLEKLNRHTCTYCNRNYTINISSKDKKITAELDHWFPKNLDKFPLLAISFYNLIPSCHSCNHSKGNPKEFSVLNWEEYFHPYIEYVDEKFTFSFNYESSIDKLKVVINVPENSKKIAKTLDEFCIEDIYNSNSEKELRDLYDLRMKYPKNYIEELFKFGLSKEEIYRMIFGIETIEEDYHKRPFSKFKHDIIEELKNIK